jgi:TetR/AcrR family transcriptional regulator, cholesterol catabolism regulator
MDTGVESVALRRKSTAKRAAILDSAARVFAARGYADVTLKDIADVAKTKAGSMYYYFDSKDDLVAEVLLEASKRVLARVEEALAALPFDATPRDKIDAALHAHLWRVARLDEYSMAHTRVFTQVPPYVRSKYIHVNRMYADLWRRILIEARDAGEIRADLNLTVVRQLLLGSVSWLRHWYDPSGPVTPQQLNDHILTMFFDGMNAKPGKRGVSKNSSPENSRSERSNSPRKKVNRP